MLLKTKKIVIQHIVKFTFLPLLALILLQSCVSKKEMLYLQDVESYNNTEVTLHNHTLQVDDILKISVGALMPEARFLIIMLPLVALLPTLLML